MTKNQQLLANMGGGSLALLLSLSLGQQASATTLVSNLSPTPSMGYPVKFDEWLRSSFTTGSGSYGYTINSVTLRLAEMTANPNLFVRLYSDSSGGLGSQITSFTNPSFTPNITNDYIFTLTTPQTLAANTAYWLVAGISEGSGEYLWAFTQSPDQTGFPGWSIGDNPFNSTNQGGIWSNNFSTAFKAFQFSVNGTENTSPPPPTNIPEPGSVVALLGLGGLGLASRLKKLSTRA
ncbi:MAG: choice-of-anchor R domain-containing protein [Microcystis sp.]|jgi:hypothetical protein|uniref:choice-of-anchor R domain-containing protein n=1 Tax=unclassified Microcystis TaxID=2643300 RepID=UPI0022BF5AA6|nr:MULTISPECIES: choice-of-anchor R domain-containing protein [unclassified Microcystis]MCE2668954.1 PEP-CTERM sorting domain-containing protein [Microcystis sp. 49638_E5]MCZ8057759.1 PEP-CTERM sorting domain-containing protein [Microcystis sp. LE19-12.2C]MDJ0547855.1 choice-of-anchor R domain-containing protein [Microcystis sp. M49637_WE12]MDJ0584321.1 choice-of-anchor R domain-containing protein [Microcystis sp. M49636_WE2]